MSILPVSKPAISRKQDSQSRDLAIAAAAAGLAAASGGALAVPAIGAAAGLTAGGMATAGMVGAGGGVANAAINLAQMGQPSGSRQQQQGQTQYSESAMVRRMKSLEGNPMADLMAADDAIKRMNVPDEVKMEYQRPIWQAMEKYKERYG